MDALLLFVGASSEVMEQLDEPFDSRGGHYDCRPLPVLAFLRDLQVAASSVLFQVQIEQLALDLDRWLIAC